MVIAKYPGFCPLCRQRFCVGRDEIVKDTNGRGWVHKICPPKFAKQSKILAENLSAMVGNENSDSFADALAIALADTEQEVKELKIESIEEKKEINWSHYQTAIFDAMIEMVTGSTDYKHMVIEAVAGSGKTTVLLEGIKRLVRQFPNLAIRIIAFNKPIADEFEKKLRTKLGDCDAHASTMHSLALSAIRKVSPKLQIDSKGEKVGLIMDGFWPVSKDDLRAGLITKSERRDNFVKRLSARHVVSICKATLTDGNNPDEVLELIEHYNIDIDQEFLEEIVKKVPIILNKCMQNTDLVDFDDMVWLPIVLHLKPEQYDVVMGDEGQDFSKANIQLIQMFVKPEGHIVIVGDRNQSLYAFRAADSNAIPNIIEMLHAKTLPLSVTYRCPSSHIEMAKKYVPQLEAREGAPKGSIEYIQYLKLAAMVQTGDMVVCRTNAPLVKPAFECIRMGKKAIIRGRDIGSSLVSLIERFETDDLGQFEVSLAEYFDREYNKLLDKGKEMQALMLQDKVETLRFIVNECSTVTELKSKIQMLFGDNSVGVVFSSVHRAKGLEADNVYILRPDLMPHPKATKDWETAQERNGVYVAYTRSKNNLIIVQGGENV